MSVYYMVEMHYPLDADREAFNTFYHNHISMLLSIDGFLSAQRFECAHTATAPFLAIYRLRDSEVLGRPAYTGRAGRDSVDPAFRARMTNWDRNLVETPAAAVEPGEHEWLLLVDRLDAHSPALDACLTPMRIVGLDATIVERGFKVGGGALPDVTAMAREGWRVRLFEPVHAARYPD